MQKKGTNPYQSNPLSQKEKDSQLAHFPTISSISVAGSALQCSSGDPGTNAPRWKLLGIAGEQWMVNGWSSKKKNLMLSPK